MNPYPEYNLAVIVLAAGLGKRMQSNLAKVLHRLIGKPIIWYVLNTAVQISPKTIVTVIGHQAEQVKSEINQHFSIDYAFQDQQLGTGHAVRCAMPQIPSYIDKILILCGDSPLIEADTLNRLVENHHLNQHCLTVLGTYISNPFGYGRVILNEDGHFIKIVEEKDATEEERRINLINTGIYCVDKQFLFDAITQLTPNNLQNEFYLTDIVEIAFRANLPIGLLIDQDAVQFKGINTLQDLKSIETLLQERIKSKINLDLKSPIKL